MEKCWWVCCDKCIWCSSKGIIKLLDIMIVRVMVEIIIIFEVVDVLFKKVNNVILWVLVNIGRLIINVLGEVFGSKFCFV